MQSSNPSMKMVASKMPPEKSFHLNKIWTEDQAKEIISLVPGCHHYLQSPVIIIEVLTLWSTNCRTLAVLRSASTELAWRYRQVMYGEVEQMWKTFRIWTPDCHWLNPQSQFIWQLACIPQSPRGQICNWYLVYCQRSHCKKFLWQHTSLLRT